jgi:hypothetical protein
MRSARNGIVPPACEKMKRMSRQRAKVPPNSRLVTALVVSNGNSSVAAGISRGANRTLVRS